MIIRKLYFILIIVFFASIEFSCKKDSLTPLESSEIVNNSKSYKNTVTDALSENCAIHEESGDYTWNNSNLVNINLNDNQIAIDGAGASAVGSIVTISSSGTYNINGSLTDGQIIVNANDDAVVRIILNGISVKCSNSSPLYIKSAYKVIVIIADNTTNYLADGSMYILDNSAENEPNATIFSKCNLSFSGNGTLNISANYADAITSKDGLIINSGTLKINAIDDAVRGKDYLVINGGDFTIVSGGDGLKSDNDGSASKGYIYIINGNFNIKSIGDALQAKTDVLINTCKMDVTSGGGSSVAKNKNLSGKGIKAGINTIIENGTFNFSSADDALHSNGNLVINGGTINITSNDDGIHADSVISCNNADIIISKSYEGIESTHIYINSGNIHINSSDDGLNIAGGNDNSGMGGWPGGVSTSNNNYYLYINGGYTYIESTGDGIDINGSVVMTDGSLIVNGPVANDNGAIDYDGTFEISGGFVLAVGSSGMSMAPGSNSSQNSILVNFSSAYTASQLIHLQKSDGTELFTFKPVKKYQSFAFSSPSIKQNTSYDIYYGGTSTGNSKDGLYSGGTYTSGTKYTTFTTNGVVTKLGNNSRF